MKVFHSLGQQVKLLKSKGLIIEDINYCKNCLFNHNYYNVINRYSDLFFLTKNPDKYKPNVKFEEIFALYIFDLRFRNIMLKYILKIEDQLKSIIAYTFSELYSPYDYRNKSNFDLGTNNGKEEIIVDFIYYTLTKKVNKNSKRKYIKHYKDNHNDIPLWVLVNILSFGDISKFFTNLKIRDRQIITKKLTRKSIVLEDECRSFIQHLNDVRNICAHNERLYDSSSNTISNIRPFYSKYSHFGHGNNNIFATFISLKGILSAKDFQKFKNEFFVIINELFTKIKSIPTLDILGKMGLKVDWYQM